MVELTKKLTKYGNAYAILVPKALIDCKVFDVGDDLKVTLEKVEWDKKAKSLKEGVKSDKPDGSIVQRGYSISTHNLQSFIQELLIQHSRPLEA